MTHSEAKLTTSKSEIINSLKLSMKILVCESKISISELKLANTEFNYTILNAGRIWGQIMRVCSLLLSLDSLKYVPWQVAATKTTFQ
jgi:hypothetical protein